MELSKEQQARIEAEIVKWYPKSSKYSNECASLRNSLTDVVIDCLESSGWISGDKTVEMLRCGRCGKPPKEDRKEGEQCLQFSNGEDWGMFCAGTIIKSTVPLPPKP